MEKTQKKKNNSVINVILYLILVVGAGIWFYPTAADYWNTRQSKRTTDIYQKKMDTMSEETLTRMWNEAREYNEQVHRGTGGMNEVEKEAAYQRLLNLNGDGMMGTIEIPAIKVSLPIFHTSSEEVLQTSVGHVEQSSLPVGGESTHCVLSAHRGNPSAKLFTNLDVLQVGDTFILNILDHTLTYEVDAINVVLPEDTELLRITTGEDLCTLVTCTPYGVNTHRLLVRGHRVENEQDEKTVRVASDAIRIEPIITAPLAALPWLILLMIYLTVTGRRRKKQER